MKTYGTPEYSSVEKILQKQLDLNFTKQ